MNDGGKPPAGLRLDRLAEEPGREHGEARQFCLDTIKEVYGIDYRRDWHVDLDSLLLPPAENHYGRRHGGAFWTVRDATGAVVATAGIRHLAWKPNIVAMFPERYPRAEEIAFLCRAYVRKDWRGQGLGTWLARLCEAGAGRLGYGSMYLHASSDALATLAFWKGAGYGFIGACDTSHHFDKRIGSEAPGRGPDPA